MMENIHYLYQHIRLDKNEPFYIGIGRTPNHERAYNKRRRTSFWKNIVSKTNYEVEILFDELTEEEAKMKEIEFIKLYGRKDLGTGTLVNLTDGGDGTVGYKHSEEWTKQMIERNKQYRHTEEAKEKIRIAAQNPSDETRKKMSQSRKGKQREFTAEALESLRFHASNISDETRAKRSKALKGRVLSEETKLKMSEAAKLRHKKQKTTTP